ncbi:hypothetical protein FRC10_004125 [Ceratobasidium sp. 414]|nr:hypothetical protein FRC10_004125 [Ceratobasidium sp. 414]
MPPSDNASEFLDVLKSAKNVVILAGAGLSAGSGIRTYRGAGGLWTTNFCATLGSGAASYIGRISRKSSFDLEVLWGEDPTTVGTIRCREATPNAAHRALASLALPPVQARLLPSLDPKWAPPLFVTQNFDGLSVKSLQDIAPQLSSDQFALARSKLIETHGSAFRTICTQCKCAKNSLEPLSCPAFDESYSRADGDEIPVGDLPRCGGRDWNGSNRYGRCGGLLRPGVVWFGEVPEQQGEIMRILNWADVLIVVGTSSLVYPAATYAGTVKDHGGKVAVFNTEPSKGDRDADFLFLGPCEQTLPEVFGFVES